MSAATLALAGCSQAGSQSGTEEAETGPLDEYLAFLWEGEEWTEERYEAENLEREELIAECMKKEGFEYTPNPDSGGWVAADDVGDEPEWGSLEFAETYGYGIIDWPGADALLEEPADYVDPNQDYVESLSVSEQDAYYATLYGEPEEVTEGADSEDASEAYSWEENGCYGWADHQMNGDDPLRRLGMTRSSLIS